MKKLLIALGLAVPLATLAAEPVAVWDGDFTTLTKGVYTLSENGNTKTDSYLEVSGGNGILLTSTDALNVFTVIARCEGLKLDAENAQVLFTSYARDAVESGTDYRDLTGVYLFSNNTNTKGIWSGADWSGETGATKSAVPANYTTLIYNHQQTNGTYAYALGPTSDEDDTVVRTTLYSVDGLRSSGTAYYGCNIGGLRGSTSETLLPATGLKITSLAVFSGTLTEAEMKGYFFPSETQTINVSENTTVSGINAQFDSSTYKTADVVAADGVTITVDEAFDNIRSVSSAGTITLSAAEQPDASYFSNVTFDVQGSLLRSWLPEPGVVGFNFYANQGSNTSQALVSSDCVWSSDASSNKGSSNELFGDGLSILSWKSRNVWSHGSGAFYNGYLDDGYVNGEGATITLTNVPYDEYDVVIYVFSDTANAVFRAKTVNGKTYTWDDATGAAVEGTATWGETRLNAVAYGKNAIRINNLTGALSIYGGDHVSGDTKRGCIAAIQIMPTGTPDNVVTCTLTLNGTATNWSEGTWTSNGEPVDAPTTGYVEIVADASTELTVDAEVALTSLKVVGGENVVVTLSNAEGGSLYAIKATIESGVFQQGSDAVLGATPTVVVEAGATFDLNGLAVNESNGFSIAGAGAGSWPWALTSSGGEFPLGTLRAFTLAGNATVGGANKIACGKSNSASYLGFGEYTLTKTGSGELAFTNIRSLSNSRGVLDISEGSVTLNGFTNLDGSQLDNDGQPWASTKVIVRADTSFESKIGRWALLDTLELAGGTVTTTSSPFNIATAVTGSGTLDRVVLDEGVSVDNLTVGTSLVARGAISVTGEGELVLAEGASVEVLADTVTATATTFTLAGKTVATDNEDGTFTFGTFDAVLAAAQSGDTVSLPHDMTGDLVLPAGVILDAGEYTLTGTVTTVEGYVVGKVGNVYSSITNDAATWVAGLMPGAWSDYFNWSTGAVPGANTVVTFPAGEENSVTFAANNGTEKCAGIVANGAVTFSRSGGSWVCLYIGGDVGGEGTLTLNQTCIQNSSDSVNEISCNLVIDGSNDSAMLGASGWKISGDLTVNGYMKAQGGTVLVTGDAVINDGAKFQTQKAITFEGDTTFAGGTFNRNTSYNYEALIFNDVTVVASTTITAGGPTTFSGTVTLAEGVTLTVPNSTIVAEAQFVTDAEGCEVKTEVGESTTVYSVVSASSDTYVVDPDTVVIDENGSFEVGEGVSIIKVGDIDVSRGFEISNGIATFIKPNVTEPEDAEGEAIAFDDDAGTVTLNVDLVPGLAYGVAVADTIEGVALDTPVMTTYDGTTETKAGILTVVKPSDGAGFFQVRVGFPAE